MEDLIQAYALGCLSIDETKQLRKSTVENPHLNKEIGKYQNLVALLPNAIHLEIPDEKVKEKLARKLYRIKNETGLKENRKEIVPSRDIAKEIINRSVTGDSSAERYVRITGQTKPIASEFKKSRDFGDIRLEPVNILKKSKKQFYYIAAAMIFGFVIAFLLFYENTDSYVTEIDKLNSEILVLDNELMAHNGLLSLLEKRDTEVYSLSGTETYPDGSGKIFVNNSSNRAYLYITGLPKLDDQKTYQLWINTSKTAYPSGLFNTGTGSSYFYFNFPRIEYDKNVRFIITEETAGGAKKPGRKVMLVNEL